MSARRPNLVVIQVDQHRFDCTGLGGHPQAHTPHLDRLAREGVVFRHAFTPTPICCPARQSLLCGQWPVRHQGLTNYDNGALRNALDPATPTYARALSEAGYACHYVGKWHVHPTLDPTAFGFDTFVSTGDYHQWRTGQPWPEPHAPLPVGGLDPAPADRTRPAWQTDRVIEHIRAEAARDRSFHIRLDFEEPHLPCAPPEPYASMFDPAAIEPWGSFADTFDGKPWIQSRMLTHWGVEAWTWAEWAPIVARYLAVIALIDDQVGRVVAVLDEAGVADDTLLIYTSDHGDMCGGHRMVDKHNVLYDDVVRVPLYARWPGGGVVGGGVCEAFTSAQIDLAPTLLAAAGVAAPDTMQGRSLLASMCGRTPGDWPTTVFAAFHGSQFGLNTMRMARDTRWKYILNATAVDELYDLERDPHELRNRADDPACADVLRDFRARLLAWGADVGDAFLTNPFVAQGL